MVSHRAGPDGRDAARLAAIGATGLAWEWLRRDPVYQALDPGGCAIDANGLVILPPLPRAAQRRWGCLAFEEPDRDHAPILWSSIADPTVLEVEAVPPRSGDRHLFDIRRWASIARLVAGEGTEHVLLGVGPAALRIDIVAGSVRDGPVGLLHRITWSPHVDRQLLTLRRLTHLCSTGRLPPVRPVPGRMHRRALTALDVHDALVEGASIRDIGILLFGAERICTEWSAPGESLKSSCRRWIALARSLAAGGYKGLLA